MSASEVVWSLFATWAGCWVLNVAILFPWLEKLESWNRKPHSMDHRDLLAALLGPIATATVCWFLLLRIGGRLFDFLLWGINKVWGLEE